MIANYGQSQKYYHDLYGCNSRLGELQSAILQIKLKFDFEKSMMARKHQASKYFTVLNNRHLDVPDETNFSNSVFHLFPVLIENGLRDQFIEYLASEGIETIIHYPIPPHKQKCFLDFVAPFPLTVTEDICSRIVSLPVGPHLSSDHIDFICESVNRFKVGP
jgi:dTDP-4-amino-4,6-dideoxygalactose transaminase